MKDKSMSVWATSIKPVLKKTGIQKPYHQLKKTLEALKLKGKSPEQVFGSIYKNNDWNGQESVSGQGSDLEETGVLLSKLPNLLRKHAVKSVIDLPCGDYNWMQHLEYDFDQYLGIDIVEELIAFNQNKFGSDKVSFKQKNCLEDNLGSADILLCRDLLIHFSNQDCQKFLQNIKRSNIRYLLTTHFIDEKNTDIATGQWRPINLCAAPFNLSDPLDTIVEETKMFDGRYAQTKTMALWAIVDLPDFK